MSKTFAEELDELLNAHAQEFKAGHLSKVRDDFLKLVEERIIATPKHCDREECVKNNCLLLKDVQAVQRQGLWEGVEL